MNENKSDESEESIVNLLSRAGWERSVATANDNKAQAELKIIQALEGIGWVPPEPKWAYCPAITNHVHGWGCTESTTVEWQADYFVCSGTSLRKHAISVRESHNKGVLVLRRQEIPHQNQVRIQLGYRTDSGKWITVVAREHML